LYSNCKGNNNNKMSIKINFGASPKEIHYVGDIVPEIWDMIYTYKDVFEERDRREKHNTYPCLKEENRLFKLSKMNKLQLKALCKKHGIKRYSKLDHKTLCLNVAAFEFYGIKSDKKWYGWVNGLSWAEIREREAAMPQEWYNLDKRLYSYCYNWKTHVWDETKEERAKTLRLERKWVEDTYVEEHHCGKKYTGGKLYDGVRV